MTRYGAFLVLFVLALFVAFHEETALLLAGLQPLRSPSVSDLDRLSDLEDRSAKLFFDQRNELEVEVPRTMPAGEFLRLYLIDFPHVRRQIAAVEGVPELADGYMLREGAVYTITLTPPQEGGP
jgi:hypothetical protein